MSGPAEFLKKEEKNMRTLKKSLCLVLALVFVLGLCTFGSNAAFAQYTDLDKVTYDEAVEVLSGLGVIEGYPDGTFNPTANVTRAEAAAMIARMMLGREDADKLPVGDVKFSDVPETNWAAKYIAFCANRGIIVGMGDGTFHPAENVTGTQMATMLLRALGYGVMGEYEGKGWDINAVADALYYGVFKDSKVVDFSNAATREETALYVWNTMWIQLVGYDVDLNYYNGREYRENGYYYPLTFAKDAFNLVKWDYAQVMANQATGADYTVVKIITGYVAAKDKDGKEIKGEYVPEYDEINLNIETGLDLIAHEVTVYFKDEIKEDKANKCDYYEVFFVKDESIVVQANGTFTDKYDDLYRELVGYNKDNKKGSFADFTTWVNYVETEDNYVEYSGGAWDLDYFYQAFKFVYYTEFAELKSQTSHNDMAYYVGATLVLTHEGLPLAALTDAYSVGKVTDVDTTHEEVEVDVWVGETDDDGNIIKAFDTEIFDLDKAYDGIAKGDYVVVQPVGELTYLEATTTKEVDITERNGTYFNRMAYYQDGSYGINEYIEDTDDYTYINVGDTVKFYISKDYGFYAYYFGTQVLEKAGLDGIVFVNYAASPSEHTEWSIKNVYKIQAINEDGEEVVYKVKKAEYDRLGGASVTQGVYKVYVNSKGYATFEAVDDSVLNKISGRNSYLKNDDGDMYYVTADTNVIYLSGVADDLEITVAGKLADKDPKGDYKVYAVTKRSGGTYKLNTVWVTEDVEAPADYADSYMFIFNPNYYGTFFNTGKLSPSGYTDLNGTETPYYKVFFDSAKKQEVFLTGDDTYFDGEKVTFGIYQYSADEDGVYTINKVSKQRTEVLEKGSVKNGKLYTPYADGLTIKVDVLDVSGDTTIDTKKDAAVNSVERLEELLNLGYTITVRYVYTVSSETGEYVPASIIYVCDVQAPEA